MTDIFVDINLDNEDWQNKIDDIEILINKVITLSILESNLPKHITQVEISVMLTDDASIRELNKEYRNIDKATNVLSFPDFDINRKNIKEVPEEFMAGDIAISLDTIEREASEQGKSLKNHFCHMMIHGTLHLMGYDHIDDDDASEMEGLETKILSDMGIDNPYE